MRPPGRLLAVGRDAEIFAYGAGRVLRRARHTRSLATEARVMRYLAERGYPTPRIEAVSADGSELVMERIDGPTMLEMLGRRPWTLRRNAHILASLHHRLHEIPGPEWLDPFPVGGDRFLHLDLHPLNVILSPTGPVVIDWANAARGAGAADVAVAWLLMTAGKIPGGSVRAVLARALRRLFTRLFLGHFDLGPIRAGLAGVAEWKCQARNMGPHEVAAMRRLVARESFRR